MAFVNKGSPPCLRDHLKANHFSFSAKFRVHFFSRVFKTDVLVQGAGKFTDRKVAVSPAGYISYFWGPDQAYLLGLLAKIKCSICSYQLNLWYVDKSRHDD